MDDIQVKFFQTCFVFSGIGGLVVACFSKETWTVRYLLGTVLFAALSGLAFALWWYKEDERGNNYGQTLSLSITIGLLGRPATMALFDRVIKKRLNLKDDDDDNAK